MFVEGFEKTAGIGEKLKGAGRAVLQGAARVGKAAEEHLHDHLDLQLNPSPKVSGYKWTSTIEGRKNRAAKLFGIKE
jgi:hypothetical protein